MNDFTEGLERIRRKKINPAIPLWILAIIFLIIGAVQAFNVYGTFDPIEGKGTTVKIDYLDGPVCDIYADEETFAYYLYTGSDSEGYYVAVGTDKESGINLFGVDYETKSEGYNLDSIRMSGQPSEITSDIAAFIGDWYGITEDDVYYNFGYYYLDTTASAFDITSTVMFALSAITLVLGIFANRKCKTKNQ